MIYIYIYQEFEAKQKGLEAVCNPVTAKLYANGEAAKNDHIEEVD